MSWIKETEEKSWLQRLCVKVLKYGKIPKHIAIIMDGNRRFAQKRNFNREQGHLMGFDKLAETLEWCLDLGITEVTVYAFSIENFKRSKQEVNALLDIAREKFNRLMQERDLLHKHGVCIRVIGDLSLVPLDIQKMIAEGVLTTKHNNKAFLNVAFAYTSREEICSAMKDVAEGVELDLIKQSDINESLLEKCLYTNNSPSPDLLLRTSGEVRLSDFLLLQTSYSVLSFMRVLWPEFSVWHLFAGVLKYQQHCDTVIEAKEAYIKKREQAELESDRRCVNEVQASKQNGVTINQTLLDEKIRQYTAMRKQRVTAFVEHVKAKRDQYLNDIYNGSIPNEEIMLT